MRNSKLFIMVLIAAIIPVVSHAYDFKEGGLCYNVNKDGKSVTMTYETLILFAYDAPAPTEKGYIGDIVVPDRIKHKGKTYKVTAIGEETFMGNSELTSVHIPSSVKNIGRGAFSNCYKLKSVVLPPNLTEINDHTFAESGIESITIPQKVKTIGQSAFSSSSLRSVIIPNSVKTIGQSAFSGCRWMERVTIGDNVESIGEAAFSICSELKDITLPTSLKEIGTKAFFECSGIESVTIPASVAIIGDGAFSYCRKLTSIKVENGNKKYDSRMGCNAIIETATNTLLAGCKDTKIPGSVTTIGNEAFAGCYGMTEINIPSSVTKISGQAFFYCKDIKELKIPNSVTSIGERAFCGCDSLEYVEMFDSVKHIGYGAFMHDKNIKYVHLGSGVTAIDSWAFRGLSALKHLSIRVKDVNNVKLGEEVFSEIDKSKCTLTVPHGTTKLYMEAPQWKDFEHFREDISKSDHTPAGHIKH